MEDYGNLAATLRRRKAERALRVAPNLDVRERAALRTGANAPLTFAAARLQRMADAELLSSNGDSVKRRRDSEPAGRARNVNSVAKK